MKNIDKLNKVLEVKPKEHLGGSEYDVKMLALQYRASDNGFFVELFDQDSLNIYDISNLDYSLFCKNTKRKIQDFIKKYHEAS